MKNKLNTITIFIFSLILILVYHRWFNFNPIIGGDWPFLFKETLKEFPLFVPSWNTWQGNGLGGTNPIYFLQSFENLTIFLANFLHIPWPIIYKIFWFGLFIILSLFSSIYLFRTILPNRALWMKLTAALIFTTNTYILMLVDGGQMGVALAYSVAPFALARFIRLIDHAALFGKNFQLALLAGLVLSLQVLFDPRIAYITMIGVTIYAVLSIMYHVLGIKDFKRTMLNTFCLILYVFALPIIITILLHIFWIFPLLFFSQNLCERFCEAYTNIGIVKFLSFSTFSQSLSSLHANWPENIFGKVTFMRPEFLVIPVLAYLSLLSMGKNKMIDGKILFFACSGIIGAFLAKGTNLPFASSYVWLFENIPGFDMFRDSTKFYLLVILSYSILIPFSLEKISEKVLSIKIRNVFYLIPVAFIIFWLFLIRPAVLGQLGGTFKNKEVPKEYVELKDFLYNQPDFFRTLWVPRQQRFTFFSNAHPSVEAGALLNATGFAQVRKDIENKGSQYFSELSIKYVIVPYDNLGEIFQNDRKYDPQLYENTVKGLESIPWLKKINGFGKIQIFEIPSHKDHLWLMGDGSISYKMSSPTHYFVKISTPYPQKLIFSEKYNPYWIAKTDNIIIKSEKTLNNLNSFALEKGDYGLEIIFSQEKIYNYGKIISVVAFLTILFFIVKLFNRKKLV